MEVWLPNTLQKGDFRDGHLNGNTLPWNLFLGEHTVGGDAIVANRGQFEIP